jgi:pSer/pThr/pTyr-binding forkhead associated (FHA) protein
MTDPPTEAFAAACRFGGPLRIGIGDPSMKSRDDFFIDRPYAVVGRDVHSDLVVDHWLVSKKHVYFQAIEGRVYAIDLGSRAGLKWATGVAAHGWADVAGGIQLGPHQVSVADGHDGRDDGKSPNWTPLAAQADEPAIPLSVRVEAGELGLEFSPKRINRPITLVGRAPGCRVRIEHPSVSNFHCALISVSDQLWMVDLLGRDGVTVNGEPTRHARLMADDVLRIGSISLRVLGGSHSTPPVRVLAKTLRRLDSQALIARAEFPSTSKSTGLQTYLQPAEARLPSRIDPSEQPDVRAVLDQFGALQSQMLDQFYQAMMSMMKFQQEAHQVQLSQMKGETEVLRDMVRELHTMKIAQTTPSPAPTPLAFPTSTTAATPPPPHFSTEASSDPAATRQAKAPQPETPAQSVTDIQDWLAKRFDSIQGEQQGRWRKLFDSVIGQTAKPAKGEAS